MAALEEARRIDPLTVTNENAREAIDHLYVQQLAVRVPHRRPKAREFTLVTR